jgi:phosphate-induced protein 1
MKTSLSPFVIGTLVLGTFVVPLSVYAQGNELNHGQDTPADGRGDRIRGVPPRAPAGGAVTTGNGINYHNGPVLHTINLYYILYGNWAQTNLNPTGTSLLTAWGNNIGGSPYFNINTTYGDTTGNVPNAVTLYPVSYTDTGSLGTSLSDSSIATLVSNAINSGKLGTAGVADPNGLYMVLTAPGVNETSGFLTQYCGWHSWGTWGTTPVQYSFVGNAAGPSLGNCAWQTASSPNGDPGVDAMVSVMAHELEETATDPQGTGWYASNGQENGDLCAWTFGTTYTAPNGSLANMVLGGKNYLIQQNWLNASGGKCVLSYAGAGPDFSISASPATFIAQKGSSGQSTISVTGLNGFTGNVSLTSACPLALTCGFSPTSVAAGSTSTLTVGASATTPGGSYTFSVSGSGTSGTHSTNVTVNVPDYTLSASPSSVTAQQGQAKTSTITVSSLGGFTGSVSLSVSGCPPNTCAVSPTSVTAPGSATLTMTTTSSTPLGTSGITITGDATHSTAVSLTVTAPADFGITVSPTSITIKRGSSGSVTVTTTVTGAASSVALSLTGLPSRTSYSFTPSSVTAGGGSTLKITINRPASTGTYPLTITGNNGTYSHGTPFALTIN